MIAALIQFALRQRLLILLLTAALAVGGVWAYRSLPIDAFPELSAPQVQVVVKATGMAPAEVESRVTLPIEMELQGLPRQTVLRSTTKYALTNIIVDFEDGTDIYWARQQVLERLNQILATLPKGVEGGLAPIATPLSDIYMYRLQSATLDKQELRALQDWKIRPRLRTVSGVADVNSLGGSVRAYEIAPRIRALLTHGLNIEDIERAIAENNRNAGGDRIDRDDKVLLVRTVGQLQNLDDIRNVTVTTRGGVPVRVADVADVRNGELVRYGGVTANGDGEVVTGLVLLRAGANGRETIAGIKRELAALAPTLPPDVKIIPFYDRSDLISTAVSTVSKSLLEAVVLVIAVLLAMLGNARAALAVAVVLPFTVLTTFLLMRYFGLSANLMSLGGLAIAIGILVDAAVVVVENIHTQLHRAHPGASHAQIVARAALEVAAPALSGVLIIVAVFLPLFALEGLEAKMFRPLVVTIGIALLTSLLLSLTLIPVLANVLLPHTPGMRGDEGIMMRELTRFYRSLLERVLNHRAITLLVAILLLAIALLLVPRLGREFLPSMDEGTVVVTVEKSQDISLERSLAMDAPIQRALMQLPEVTGVVSRSGADELRLDPMGFNQTDYFLLTKPRAEWTSNLAEFRQRVRGVFERFPDLEFALTQPIEMRVSEMLTGVRADVAVKIFGDDIVMLEDLSARVEQLSNTTPGATDVFRPLLSGQHYLQIEARRDRMARYGVNTEELNRTVETAIGGRVVSEVLEGARRTAILLRYPANARDSVPALNALLIRASGDAHVPLSALADIREVEGPMQIQREFGRRMAIVRMNVKDRDIVGFVDELRARIDNEIKLPVGYSTVYGGQFENEQRATRRLLWVAPVSIALIFVLLFVTFGTVRHTVLVLLNVPFALIGGVISLYVAQFYLSVPAAVGFITLFGVAVLNGVVMISYFIRLRDEGMSIIDITRNGAERRLRPVLMTALIASIGLIPMLLASGPGSEIQKPLAVVVMGGLLTSTALTLLLLPMFYQWMEENLTET